MKSLNKYFTAPSKKTCKTSTGVSLTMSKPKSKKPEYRKISAKELIENPEGKK
jgi:hypothetical protein